MQSTIITQKLTEGGVLGVILMLIGPAAVGFAFATITAWRPGVGDVSWAYYLAGAGGFLSVVSLPLIIVGRQYTMKQVTHEDKARR